MRAALRQCQSGAAGLLRAWRAARRWSSWPTPSSPAPAELSDAIADAYFQHASRSRTGGGAGAGALMDYLVRHRTTYRYLQDVSHSWHLAHLSPRTTPLQTGA